MMMLEKITNKQVFLIVLALGVAVCLVVYMLVFTKYNDQTTALKASNAQLEAQVNEMKEYYDNIEVYRANAKEMVASIAEITADYPADAREEDVVMMAVAMQNRAIINYDKINVEQPKVIHNISEDIVKESAIEGLEQPIQFMERQATYSNVTTYASLKTAIATVYESPYRIGIKAVSYRKNSETNNFIQGTIDITYYSISGMGKEYTPPEMPSYFGGASDLFGQITFKQEAEDAVGTGETAE